MTQSSSPTTPQAWSLADIPHLQRLHAAALSASALIGADDPEADSIFARVEQFEQALSHLLFGATDRDFCAERLELVGA